MFSIFSSVQLTLGLTLAVAAVAVVSARFVSAPIWLPNKELYREALFPAGIEDGKPYYIGRALMYGGKVPGKVFDDTDTIWVGYNGKEQEWGTYELLVYPRGVLTWNEVITFENNTSILPENMFQGGADPMTDEPFYICRAWHENMLIVGKMSKITGVCEVPWRSVDHKRDIFDVLVDNRRSPCSSRWQEEGSSGGSTAQTIVLSVALFVIAVMALIALGYYFGWIRYLAKIYSPAGNWRDLVRFRKDSVSTTVTTVDC